jgi:CHAT domain-containing protein
MKLNANLVVLSACNTGIGTLTDGEGMMSLSTGFAYAGVNSVVSTLWGVNDKSTADLMKKFYERLFNAEKKPEALRNARLDYLDEADQLFAHPFYWAGFIAIGNTQPIAGAGGFWRTSLILLALAGISIAVWMYMKEGNKA